MISLKTVFNYIKFANELTNKVSFMFNGVPCKFTHLIFM